jgi:hypothetical protein
MSVVINGTSGITGNTGTLISASTIGVGGATPSASGAGITFPATANLSTNANTLDDYEEGSWTPTIGGSATNPTGIVYSSQSGSYTRVGNVVYIAFRIQFSFTNGTGSGSLEIRGLPFTSTNTAQPKSTPQQDNISFAGFTYLEIGCTQNTAFMGIGANRSGSTANSIAVSACNSSNTDINGGIMYFV